MKITVISDSKGQVVGTIKGHIQDFYAGDMRAGPVTSEGMKLHEIEVPDEFEKYYQYSEPQQAGLVIQEESVTKKSLSTQQSVKPNLDELHKKVTQYIKK